MIHGLHIDYLEPGGLPIYHVEEGETFLAIRASLNRVGMPDAMWSINRIRNQRAILPLDIDLPHHALPDRLREWIAALDSHRDGDGSLIFPVRAINYSEHCAECGAALYEAHREDCDSDHNNWVLAGIALVPGRRGTPLNGADPVDIILEACRHRYRDDRQHDAPQAIQDALQRIRERKQDKLDVQRRALLLLREGLDPYQLDEWERYGEISVFGADGYTYTIKPGQGHNVYRVEEGVRTVEYCIVTQGYTPDADLMLAQKLLLERMPEAFHAKANVKVLDGPYHPNPGEELAAPIDEGDPHIIPEARFQELIDDATAGGVIRACHIPEWT